MKFFLIFLGTGSLFLIEHLKKLNRRQICFLQFCLFLILILLINGKLERYLIDVETPQTYLIQDYTLDSSGDLNTIHYQTPDQADKVLTLSNQPYQLGSQTEKGEVLEQQYATTLNLVLFNQFRIPLFTSKPTTYYTVTLNEEFLSIKNKEVIQ